VAATGEAIGLITHAASELSDFAPTYLADQKPFGNLKNGLRQINRYTLHRTSPSKQSPQCYGRT
jgi:hypothetical protein